MPGFPSGRNTGTGLLFRCTMQPGQNSTSFFFFVAKASPENYMNCGDFVGTEPTSRYRVFFIFYETNATQELSVKRLKEIQNFQVSLSVKMVIENAAIELNGPRNVA
jgi:hypothetical protein